jgi:hypothetical protein
MGLDKDVFEVENWVCREFSLSCNSWKWLPSIGSVGGILMGLDKDVFEVENWVCREFSLSCDVVYKRNKKKYRITTVYGAAEEGRKQWFVDELHSMLVGRKEATIIGGGGGALI